MTAIGVSETPERKMGLEEFQDNKSSEYKMYRGHEYDEKLEEMVDEFQDKFPVDLRVEFIEVSPRMDKTRAMAYRRPGKKYYIRVSEKFIETSTEERIRLTVLHEMVHVYFYQKGYSDTNHDKFFRWVVGHVGASMTHTSIKSSKWQDCIEPFKEMED